MPVETTLMTISKASDISAAAAKWPAVKDFKFKTGDVIKTIDPNMLNLPKSFVIMRGGDIVFGCGMSELELNK